MLKATFTDKEFYEVYEVPWNGAKLDLKLQKREHGYNCVRPRQSSIPKCRRNFYKTMASLARITSQLCLIC